jgi:hypothetical protein
MGDVCQRLGLDCRGPLALLQHPQNQDVNAFHEKYSNTDLGFDVIE